MRTLYGWVDGDKFCLSLFPKIDKKPVNYYDTQIDAVKEAERRGLQIKWL